MNTTTVSTHKPKIVSTHKRKIGFSEKFDGSRLKF